MSGEIVLRPEGHPQRTDHTHYERRRLAVIGAGAMGEALLNGWILAGWKPSDILVVDSAVDRVASLCSEHGIGTGDLAEAAHAQTVVVAVKPHHIADVLDELTPHLPGDTLIVSIAAGVRLAELNTHLPEGQPIVRVMPNTPALVGQGMAGIVQGKFADAEHRDRVVELMNAVGRSIVVPEHSLDALTALSGSGPAYLFMVAEAMVEAGVHQGLTRDQATLLVNQTFLGAATMLDKSGESATVLRERVTSPGGTTAAALRELEEHGVRAAFLGAVEACAHRSRSLRG